MWKFCQRAGSKHHSQATGKVRFRSLCYRIGTLCQIMPREWIDETRNKLSALWKRALSYRKSTWELRDYPVRIRELKVELNLDPTRFKQARYVASIINWWVMDGTGNTPEEALLQLKGNFEVQKFDRWMDGKPLPRPGTHVPIELASQEQINKHDALSADFLRRVLGVESAWITDETCLWHFLTTQTDEEVYDKIKEIYGVDVSDIKSGRLVEIFERIIASRAQANSDQ